MKPTMIRPTAAMLILSTASIGFFTLLLSDNFGADEAGLILWLLPGVIIGLVLSRWVRPHLDRPWFRPLVLVVAMIGGLALVARQLVS